MDWLTFFSSLVDSIAWPLAILIIVWWLKDYIKKLIPYTSKLKYGDLEIEFGEKLAELKVETEKLKKEHPAIALPEVNKEYLDKDTSNISPRTAIVEAWIALELTAFNFAKHYNIVDTDKQPFIKILKLYEEKQILQKDEIEVIRKLQKLRNQALHESSFDISQKEAEEYSRLARDMEEIIMSECWQKFGGCSH